MNTTNSGGGIMVKSASIDNFSYCSAYPQLARGKKIGQLYSKNSRKVNILSVFIYWFNHNNEITGKFFHYYITLYTNDVN